MTAVQTPVVVLAITLGAAATVSGQPRLAPPTVAVEEITEDTFVPRQTFVGETIPSRTSVVGSAVDGRVVELFVNDGDPVKWLPANKEEPARGQPIAQLLTDTITIEIAAAEATCELRRQQLAELQAGTREEEKAQAKARLEAADAALVFATSQFDRIQSLFEQGQTVSREEFEEALSLRLAAEQARIAAKAAYELAVLGPRVEQIKQAEAQLLAAQEEVRRLEDRRAKFTIRAPFAGHVAAKRTEVGAWLSVGEPVAEIVALDPIEVNVAVPESAITSIRLGAAAEVRIDALPNETFPGTVARIVPQALLPARTFPVKVQLPNPDSGDGPRLKAGMLAQVTLPVGAEEKAWFVPKDALVLGGPSPMVLVVDQDPATRTAVVRGVPVRIGVSVDSRVQISGDLRRGQQIVVMGNERVFPGQPVIAVPAGNPSEKR